MTESPRFRIVVPTHGRPQQLERLLDALVPQLLRHRAFHLVVVNDGSDNAAYQQVIEPHRPVLTYLPLPQNGGVGPARMKGYDGATEDYLVATDDDCVPPSNWLDRLRALAETYPEVDLFAGTTKAIDLPRGVIVREISNIPNAVPAPAMQGTWFVNAVTANVMYRRDTFERAGGFAEDMPGSCEDCFLTQRIQKIGGIWMIAPELVTGHRAIQSVGELLRKFRGYGRGAAQLVIREQDARLASILKGRPTGTGCLRRSWRAAGLHWREARRREIDRFHCGIQTGLAFAGRLAYEYGLWRGTGAFEARYGRSFPNEWRLRMLYNDFCSEIALATQKRNN